MGIARDAIPTGFVPLPRRWVVERIFAWLATDRRLVVEYDELLGSSEARVHLAMSRLMTTRLARSASLHTATRGNPLWLPSSADAYTRSCRNEKAAPSTISTAKPTRNARSGQMSPMPKPLIITSFSAKLA